MTESNTTAKVPNRRAAPLKQPKFSACTVYRILSGKRQSRSLQLKLLDSLGKAIPSTDTYTGQHSFIKYASAHTFETSMVK